MAKAVYQMEQLTCPACVKKIETALTKTNGVESASVLFNSSKAKVDFDETLVSVEQLQEVITKLGYQVLSVKA